MPTYYLTGLMYINGCHGTEDQRVLIPDGSSGDIEPPLDATILVAKDDLVKIDFEPPPRERELDVDGKPAIFFEFPLKKRSRIRLPHSGGAKCVKLDRGLPRAEDAEFVPNLDDPDTIAEIELGGGTLQARALDGVPIVEWTVDDKREEVTITATLLDEKRKPTGKERTLTVKGTGTVVFVHSSDLFAEAPKDHSEEPEHDWSEGPGGPPTSASHHEHGHYTGAKLYSKIAAKEVDPKKFYAHRKARDLQDDIPDNEQRSVLKGLKKRHGWKDSDPPWCCPTTLPHP